MTTATSPHAPRPDALRWPQGGLMDFRDHPACAPLEIVDAAAGRVRDPLGRTKVAIVGFCHSTRDLAPYHDPEWQVWGLNQLYRYIPRADAWTEIHLRSLWERDAAPGTDYLGWLRKSPLPILVGPTDYDAGRYHDIPNAVRFPIEEAMALTGGVGRLAAPDTPLDYFQSSIAFMFAWALLSGAKEIGIWGVDLNTNEEWAYQRPNLEFWIGLAKGLGTRVILPEHTALLTNVGRVRYGDLETLAVSPEALIHPRMLERRLAFLRAQQAKVRARIAEDQVTDGQMEAAIRETGLWAEVWDLKWRGGRVEYDDGASAQEAAPNG